MLKNYYEINDNIIKIKIERKDGKIFWTAISIEDIQKLDCINKVYACWNANTQSYYAMCSYYINNQWFCKPMHQLILGFPNMLIDHRNHNTLDNTRNNLRTATIKENSSNCKPRKGTSSQYKGVSWNKTGKKWVAYIKKDQKRIYLGCYVNEYEASQVYNQAAQELFGEFAYLNI
jgi:hypothetical protein